MSEYRRNSGFIHSVKVPRLYKVSSRIVKTVLEEGGSIKELLYTTVKTNLKGTYALITKTIQYNGLLDKIITKTKLLEENPQLNVWLAKTLITELLLGKGCLQGESKPVQTIWNYSEALKSEFEKHKQDEDEENVQELRKPRYARVNTLRATTDEVIKELRNEGWEFVPFRGPYNEFLQLVSNLKEHQFVKDMHIKDLLVFPPRTEFHQHHLYHDATIILQDKASCLPPLVLQPDPSGTTLDMCAAPGMKTTMLSSMMRGKGKIYAVERNSRRYNDMQNLVTAAGCANVTTLLADSLSLSTEDTSWCSNVKFILVDPTCSGSGMTERARLFTRPQTEERIRQLAAFQRKLLHHALTSFPSAQRVVYSTCSILSEENEAVVEAVLSRLPPNSWHIVPALPEWSSRGSDEYSFGTSCLTADPKEDLTTGFFIAVFERMKGNVEMSLNDNFVQNSDKGKTFPTEYFNVVGHANGDNSTMTKDGGIVYFSKYQKKVEKFEETEPKSEYNMRSKTTAKKKKKKKLAYHVDECETTESTFEENSQMSTRDVHFRKKKKEVSRETEGISCGSEDFNSGAKRKVKKNKKSADEHFEGIPRNYEPMEKKLKKN